MGTVTDRLHCGADDICVLACYRTWLFHASCLEV